MTKTVEQLRAEAEAAQEALRTAQRAEREAEEAAKRAEREAALEKQRHIELAARQIVVDNVIAALVDAGIGAAVGLVQVERTYQKVTSYRSVATGWQVTVQTHSGPARRFPVKADGSFNAPKIIAAVKNYIEIAEAAKARKEAEDARKKDAAEIATRLTAEFGPDRVASSIGYYLPTGTARQEYRETIASPGKVFVKLGNLDCTEEQARIMLEAFARAFPR